MKKYLFLILIFILIGFSSCTEKANEKPKDWKKINKKLIEVNKYMVKEDRERIEKYIIRNNLEMTETETGLWFYIDKKGSGDYIKENQIANIKYKIELLDGTYCYSSDSSGILSFKVGKADVANGLQQGILKMRKGDKAVFILPPHLGYGLVGDDNKIPARSILVYTVELIEIQ